MTELEERGGEQSKPNYKYLLPLYEITALAVRGGEKLGEEFPKVPENKVNRPHYHGDLQQQGLQKERRKL